jgi:uncharacterized protein with HEPN domain
MVDAIESVQRFVAGRQRADLDADEMLRFAVVRAIEVVGEAATRTSDSLRAAHPEVPWIAIAGMRNRLVHAYFDIDTEIVWSTACEALPRLRAQLIPLLASP